MSTQNLLNQLNQQPEQVSFQEVINTIDTHYNYTPSRFSNGQDGDCVVSEAGSNIGSCKIFAFAKLNELNEQQTLHCFGDYYRVDVLQHPDGDDHGNIRSFIRHGWQGIQFDQMPLSEKG